MESRTLRGSKGGYRVVFLSSRKVYAGGWRPTLYGARMAVRAIRSTYDRMRQSAPFRPISSFAPTSVQ